VGGRFWLKVNVGGGGADDGISRTGGIFNAGVAGGLGNGGNGIGDGLPIT